MRRLLEKQPHDALAAYNLAAALEGEGRFQDAAAAYQAQLVVQPGDARLLNGLGGALESEGEWQSARKTYEQAVAASPDNCDARFNLARLELNTHSQPMPKHNSARCSTAALPTRLSTMASPVTRRPGQD